MPAFDSDLHEPRTNAEQSETGGDIRVSFESLGFVYFIRAGRTNAVKIGWTLKPDARLRDLQCGSPHPLHLIGYMPGDRFIEAEWHSRFADERIRGEWFNLSFRLRSAIMEASLDSQFVRYLSLSLVTRGAA